MFDPKRKRPPLPHEIIPDLKKIEEIIPPPHKLFERIADEVSKWASDNVQKSNEQANGQTTPLQGPPTNGSTQEPMLLTDTWAEPCKRLHTLMRENNLTVKAYRPDSPEGRSLQERYGITAIPALVMPDGSVIMGVDAIINTLKR